MLLSVIKRKIVSAKIRRRCRKCAFLDVSTGNCYFNPRFVSAPNLMKYNCKDFRTKDDEEALELMQNNKLESERIYQNHKIKLEQLRKEREEKLEKEKQLWIEKQREKEKIRFDRMHREAEKGDASAKYYLAEMYYKGNGVNKDKNQAFHWYIESAENGYELAIKKLIEITNQIRGKTLLSDIEKRAVAVMEKYFECQETKKHQEKKCQQEKCQRELQNERKRQHYNLAQRATNSCDVEARFELAETYLNGIGTEVNLDKAIKWYATCVMDRFNLNNVHDYSGLWKKAYDMLKKLDTPKNRAAVDNKTLKKWQDAIETATAHFEKERLKKEKLEQEKLEQEKLEREKLEREKTKRKKGKCEDCFWFEESPFTTEREIRDDGVYEVPVKKTYYCTKFKGRPAVNPYGICDFWEENRNKKMTIDQAGYRG